MTISEAAAQILAATRSDCRECADEALHDLHNLLAREAVHQDLASATAILKTALTAAYMNRAHVLQQLQQLEKSDSYLGSPDTRVASWQLTA